MLVKSISDVLAVGQAPPDEVVECLREVTTRLPNWEGTSFILIWSLWLRFSGTHSHDDYDEAMSIIDRFIADPIRDVEMVRQCMEFAELLAVDQFQFYGKPEHLEEAIFRIRTLLNVLSFENPRRHDITQLLAHFEEIRFNEFGVASDRPEDNTEVVDRSHLAAASRMAKANVVEYPSPMLDVEDPNRHLDALLSMVHTTDLADVKKAIEYCKSCLTSPHLHLLRTLEILGHLLNSAFSLTDDIDYLNELIAVHHILLNLPGAWLTRRHQKVQVLIAFLFFRFSSSEDRKDLDEIMRLFPIASTDANAPAPDRFKASCLWVQTARASRHPSTSNAYENAMSLIHKSLAFAPTLEIQHFRLVTMRDEYEKLPLDYASYLVEMGQLKQALENLEQGRALLWSEMRGLRTSIGQLAVVDLPLAEKFATVNRNLEAVTMLDSTGVWMDGCQVNGGEGMDPFGRLVVKQQKLIQERDRLLSQIQSMPGFDTFLSPPSFDMLRSAAVRGPVIVINHSKWRSDIIILLYDSPPSLIQTTDDFYDRAKHLRDKLLTARNEGLESGEYENTLGYVLESLYDLVGRPVIQRLHELDIQEQSRIWWCPTSVFCSLPLHAMGPIQSRGSTKLYFSDLYIPSYTPSLSALIESCESSAQPFDEPSMLLVVQPDAQMPNALQEMRAVQAVCPSVETLLWETATPIAALQHVREHRFTHISCHGTLEIGKPFDSFLKLHEGARLTLLDIVRSQLPAAEFAFLSACHTAEIMEESIADEGLHLAAAVQYSGFRSAVGTMWAMADIDGPDLAGHFYRSVFSNRWEGVPYYERTAEALRDAVRNLRRKGKMSLERWVNYVHYGA